MLECIFYFLEKIDPFLTVVNILVMATLTFFIWKTGEKSHALEIQRDNSREKELIDDTKLIYLILQNSYIKNIKHFKTLSKLSERLPVSTGHVSDIRFDQDNTYIVIDDCKNTINKLLLSLEEEYSFIKEKLFKVLPKERKKLYSLTDPLNNNIITLTELLSKNKISQQDIKFLEYNWNKDLQKVKNAINNFDRIYPNR